MNKWKVISGFHAHEYQHARTGLSAVQMLDFAIRSTHPKPDISALAKAAGVSRPTVYQWKRVLTSPKAAAALFSVRYDYPSLERRLRACEARIKKLQGPKE